MSGPPAPSRVDSLDPVPNPAARRISVKLQRIPRPYLYAGILMFAALGS